jgi:VWFA-related protein
MKCFFDFRRLLALVVLLSLSTGSAILPVFGQARRQPPVSNKKKNTRPPEGGEQPEEKQDPLPPEIVNKPQDAEKIEIKTALVNVDAVVYQKKSKQVVTGLKRENFAVFEDGVKKEITNFSTPEAPITVALVVEFSKLGEQFGYAQTHGMEPGQAEVLRPMAMFLAQFMKPPQDYVTVIAYDMRPTPITDFTNDPRRIQETISFMLRQTPAFRETNLFDALKFTMIGGRGDSVAMEESKSETSEYAGIASVQGRRTAVILVGSGIDTFSKINYGQARKILQNAGVPVYIIGTGNMYFKRYGDQLGALDSLLNDPGRLSFLQAQNALTTFAKETGGAYFPVTFEGEVPQTLRSIDMMLRSQYSLGYRPGEARDGKQHKIVVKVDVDGDGQYDDKEYIVNARQFYNAPKDEPAK